LKDGRKNSIAFTMKQYGFLHTSISRQSVGRYGWTWQLRKSFLGMRHMLHVMCMHGKRFPRVQ
jgi:hypothetical protein